MAQRENSLAGCSKRPSSKAAGESKPEAYPQGRTVRRIRSTTFVRAAELVRRPERLSGEHARRQACRSSESAIAAEAFMNNAGYDEQRAGIM